MLYIYISRIWVFREYKFWNGTGGRTWQWWLWSDNWFWRWRFYSWFFGDWFCRWRSDWFCRWRSFSFARRLTWSVLCSHMVSEIVLPVKRLSTNGAGDGIQMTLFMSFSHVRSGESFLTQTTLVCFLVSMGVLVTVSNIWTCKGFITVWTTVRLSRFGMSFGMTSQISFFCKAFTANMTDKHPSGQDLTCNMGLLFFFHSWAHVWSGQDLKKNWRSCYSIGYL